MYNTLRYLPKSDFIRFPICKKMALYIIRAYLKKMFLEISDDYFNSENILKMARLIDMICGRKDTSIPKLIFICSKHKIYLIVFVGMNLFRRQPNPWFS